MSKLFVTNCKYADIMIATTYELCGGFVVDVTKYCYVLLVVPWV